MKRLSSLSPRQARMRSGEMSFQDNLQSQYREEKAWRWRRTRNQRLTLWSLPAVSLASVSHGSGRSGVLLPTHLSFFAMETRSVQCKNALLIIRRWSHALGGLWDGKEKLERAQSLHSLHAFFFRTAVWGGEKRGSRIGAALRSGRCGPALALSRPGVRGAKPRIPLSAFLTSPQNIRYYRCSLTKKRSYSDIIYRKFSYVALKLVA